MPPISPGRTRVIKPEPTDVKGKCIECGGPQKPYVRKGIRRYQARCQKCLAKRCAPVDPKSNSIMNRIYSRRQRLRRFGLTEEIHDMMLADQDYKCAICEKSETEEGRGFAIDHNHKTHENRGLLCFHCNTGLGKFGDDVESLKRAVAYLEKY